jgi:predicted O-methyltransferase YrrM
MLRVETPNELYAELMEERPKLHGAHDGTTLTESAAFDWSLHPAVLRWLIGRVRPGSRTLETGCGYSTIVFALWHCHHHVVSPFPEEHRCINDWCGEHGVSVETVTYHAGFSQRVLPALEAAPLDLVLIDGDHAVPMPLIDFYYTADRLAQGGLLLVDDVQLRSVQQLCNFLDTEMQRWRFVEQVDRTRVYRKRVAGRVIEGILWNQQLYCATPSPLPPRAPPSLLYRGLRKMKRTLVG